MFGSLDVVSVYDGYILELVDQPSIDVCIGTETVDDEAATVPVEHDGARSGGRQGGGFVDVKLDLTRRTGLDRRDGQAAIRFGSLRVGDAS